MTNSVPLLLDETVDYRHPDALLVGYTMHSQHCYTVEVVDSDYRCYIWRAHLSLDLRWTLSPVDHATYTAGSGSEGLDAGWTRF